MSCLIVDGFSLAFRSFYSFPPTLTLTSGQPINAVMGVMTLLLQIIDKLQPSHLVICFDLPHPTFRHDLFSGYKATRKPAPDAFKTQIPLIKSLLADAGFYCLEQKGYEADDLMAHCAIQTSGEGMHAYIFTGDYDAFQLINSSVSVCIPQKGQDVYQLIDREAVFDKLGVYPEGIVDYKALCGDASDNIPGVKGVGKKTASALLVQFGTLESLYNQLDTLSSKSLQQKLKQAKNEAFLSQQLAKIESNVGVSFCLDQAKLSIDWKVLKRAFEQYSFKRLLSQYAPKFNDDTPVSYTTETLPSLGVYSLAQLRADSAVLSHLESGFSFYLHTTQAMDENSVLCGISFCTTTKQAFYISLQTADAKESNSTVTAPLFTLESTQTDVNLSGPLRFVVSLLQPYFEDSRIKKIAYDIKFCYKQLKQLDITLSDHCMDIQLAGFLCHPLQGSSKAACFQVMLQSSVTECEATALAATSNSAVSSLYFGGFFPYYLMQLQLAYAPILKKKGLLSLLTEIELPMQFVLAKMEQIGVCLDLPKLHALNHEVSEAQSQLRLSIFEQAGMSFNINSTQQLAHVLFDCLQLPVIKKNKTGRSTNAAVLEKLQPYHPIISTIIEYRENEKLLNTYIQPLPHLIHPKTQRIHTTYNQHITLTGRLSSVQPNLQNIPIRTLKGQKIREVFIPKAQGRYLLAADYSQIELRLMAHFSQDAAMIEAFKQNSDIHAATAATIFHCSLDEVTPEQRYRAKSVNFGIIYGMSAFSLAKQLSCSREEAEQLIADYFSRFSAIKSFIDSTIKRARKEGVIRTGFGRIRPFPNIVTGDHRQRQFEERAAVNTLLQGTAADILKKAMITVCQRLTETPIDAALILQVHDELVFDVAVDETKRLTALLHAECEHVVSYLVPLPIQVAVGINWNLDK